MPRIRQYADKYAMQDLVSHIMGRMKANGLTQQGLGEKIKMSQQCVSYMLNHPDKITLETMRKLCKAVELDQDVVTKAFWCECTGGKRS